jgi:hypothetical protein
MRREILVIGAMIAAVIILFRVILGTPLVQRVRESFASSSPTLNSQTECPAGSQMYMYGGIAYCCSSKINPDASTVTESCRPTTDRDTTVTFCTLGPSRGGVPNCLQLRSGLMQAEGEKYCPATIPTFVKGPSGERCCADSGNIALTECASTNSRFCNVSADTNIFKDPTSCQFLKAQQDTEACPSGYGPFTATGNEGTMAGITLFGCTDRGTNCYAESTLKRLKELGYDVTGLPSCRSK